MTLSHTPPVRHVLCLAGSLRRESWNRRLLHAAAANAPATLRLEVSDGLAAVPMFNEDLERCGPDGSTGVRCLRAAIAAADGLVLATPEYNHAMPGVLKNALDWLSRESPEGEVLVDKPVAVLGATAGSWGTRLAQASLRQVLHTCGALVMPAPTVFIAHAADRFDVDDSLADQGTVQSLQHFVLAFERWMTRVSPAIAQPPAALTVAH